MNPSSSLARSRRPALPLALAAIAAAFALLGSPLPAQSLYYDLNDSAAGSAAGAGNWTTNNDTGNLVWSTDAAGEVATGNWTNGSSAVFSAGTDGTSGFTVTAISTPQAGNVTFEEGNVTISGTIQLSLGGNLSVASTAGNTVTGTVSLQTGSDSTRYFTNDSVTGTLTLASITRASASSNHAVVFGGAGNITVTTIQNIALGSITKNGAGTLTLNGRSNQANQAVTVNGGVLNLGLSAQVTTATGNTALTLANGTLRTNHNRVNGISTATHNVTLGVGGGTFEPTGVTTLTFNGAVNETGGSQNLTKTGSGTLVLAGANTYTGETTVAAGTLDATGATSLTNSSAISVTGGNVSAAGLTVGGAADFSAKTVIVSTLNGGAYQKNLTSTAAYTTYGSARSEFAGGTANTTATFLAGSAGADRSVLTSLSAITLAAVSNDAARISDVFSLAGTGDDIFVLQLNVAGVNASTYLAWNDGGAWENAVLGNVGPDGGSVIAGYAGSFALSNATATSDYLGSWGYDTANSTVWAILDHGGEFAVVAVPEPGAALMVLGGFGLLGLLRRRS